jgi:hypothetical protein
MVKRKTRKAAPSKSSSGNFAATSGVIDETPSTRLSHSDLVYVLRGMRVDVPPHTKIPAEKLEARLEKALAVAQRSQEYFHDTGNEITTVDPKSLPICTELEQILIAFCKLGPRQGTLPKLDWFSMDEREITTRQVSAVLYFFFEQVEESGIDCVSYLDEKSSRALIVRVRVFTRFLFCLS